MKCRGCHCMCTWHRAWWHPQSTLGTARNASHASPAVSGWVAVWLGYSLVRVLERALLSRQSLAWNSSTSRHADSLFLRSHFKDVSSPSLLFPRQREQKTKFICIGTERAGVNQPGTAPELLGGTTATELSVCLSEAEVLGCS